MALPPGAAEKLGRADHHINDLNRQIQAYLDQRPFKIVHRVSPITFDFTVVAKTEIPVPAGIALTLGDAIHNLRATLDLIYFAIISRYTTDGRGIQFPIYRLDGNRKESVFGTRKIKLAPKEVKAAIEASEPHPGGQYSIYELDALDVRDKHRLLVVIGQTVRLTMADMAAILPSEFFGHWSGGGPIFEFDPEGQPIASMALPANNPRRSDPFEQDIAVSPTFTLVFADEPFRRETVIPTLAKLRENVARVAQDVWNAAN